MAFIVRTPKQIGHILMGRKRSYIPLNVFLNNRLVGHLNRQKNGTGHPLLFRR